jgi:hypothetical protein
VATVTGSHQVFGAPNESLVVAAGYTVIGALGDTITAGPSDLITGGPNSKITSLDHDTIYGGADDTIFGGTNDHLFMGLHDTIVAAAGDSIIGYGDTITAQGHDTVTGTPLNETVSGFTGADKISFAGESSAAIQKVLANETHSGGNTTLHLPDGSSITLVGISHPTSGIFG